MEDHEALQLLREHKVTVEADPDTPAQIVHKLGICLQTTLECVPCETSAQTVEASQSHDTRGQLWPA